MPYGMKELPAHLEGVRHLALDVAGVLPLDRPAVEVQRVVAPRQRAARLQDNEGAGAVVRGETAVGVGTLDILDAFRDCAPAPAGVAIEVAGARPRAVARAGGVIVDCVDLVPRG